METALLMGILIPVLFGILWVSCLLYEKGILQGAVSQSVFLENMRPQETGQESFEEEMRRQSLGKAKLSFSIACYGDDARAEGSLEAFVPGILASLFQDGTVRWEVQAQNSWADGTKRIRAVCQEKALMEREDAG